MQARYLAAAFVVVALAAAAIWLLGGGMGSTASPSKPCKRCSWGNVDACCNAPCLPCRGSATVCCPPGAVADSLCGCCSPDELRRLDAATTTCCPAARWIEERKLCCDAGTTPCVEDGVQKCCAPCGALAACPQGSRCATLAGDDFVEQLKLRPCDAEGADDAACIAGRDASGVTSLCRRAGNGCKFKPELRYFPAPAGDFYPVANVGAAAPALTYDAERGDLCQGSLCPLSDVARGNTQALEAALLEQNETAHGNFCAPRDDCSYSRFVASEFAQDDGHCSADAAADRCLDLLGDAPGVSRLFFDADKGVCAAQICAGRGDSVAAATTCAAGADATTVVPDCNAAMTSAGSSLTCRDGPKLYEGNSCGEDVKDPAGCGQTKSCADCILKGGSGRPACVWCTASATCPTGRCRPVHADPAVAEDAHCGEGSGAAPTCPDMYWYVDGPPKQRACKPCVPGKAGCELCGAGRQLQDPSLALRCGWGEEGLVPAFATWQGKGLNRWLADQMGAGNVGGDKGFRDRTTCRKFVEGLHLNEKGLFGEQVHLSTVRTECVGGEDGSTVVRVSDRPKEYRCTPLPSSTRCDHAKATKITRTDGYWPNPENENDAACATNCCKEHWTTRSCDDYQTCHR